jgi:hypothetical protein
MVVCGLQVMGACGKAQRDRYLLEGDGSPE